MNFKKYHVSRNLFDKSKRTDNSRVVYTTGEIGALYGVFVSDFTPIEPNTTYTLNIVSGISGKTGHLFALYDENKNFVNTGSHEATQATVYTFTTPANVAYIRFNGNVESVDETMLNTGSTPLPYEPYSSEVWHDTPHYIHNTSTDTIATLPAVLYPNDTTATVGLKGNMSQTGTPTPDNPIQPQETGERTGNLWNEDYTGISGNLKYVPVYVDNGSFTLSTSCPVIEGAAALFFLAGNVQSGASTVSNGVYKDRPITVASSNGYVTVVYRYVSYASGISDPRNEKTMLNLGSTALPYEPFGVKIPISSADTTTNNYLGEVETTRKVQKLVLTGKEFWQLWNGNYFSSIIDRKGVIDTIFCSHFINSSPNGISYQHQSTSGLKISSVVVPFVTSVSELKAWLAAQYAAGTPVCVWYVLATEETGIVNEPLRKIGDYADTVSGIPIPVTAGGDTISVDTTLQPSEVTVNYHGWHPVADVHERDNGAWT